MKNTNKIVVKFLAIDYYTGKRKNFTHTYFTDKTFQDKHGVLFGTSIPYVTTAASQAEAYVDEIDKAQLMVDNDLMTILDYKVTFCTGMAPKEKKPREKKKDEATLLLEFYKEAGVSVRHLPDLAAAYSKMKDIFKSLKISIPQKAQMLMTIACVGMEAHVAGMHSALRIIKGEDEFYNSVAAKILHTAEEESNIEIAK